MVRLGEFFPKSAGDEAVQDDVPLTQRFDIFKGFIDRDGTLRRLRSVGIARLAEGQHTYVIRLKTFLNDDFYLLPERCDLGGQADFTILTRERSTSPRRRFFWHKVGEAVFLPPPAGDVLHLCWDLFGASDLYMRMTPMPRPVGAYAAQPETESQDDTPSPLAVGERR